MSYMRVMETLVRKSITRLQLSGILKLRKAKGYIFARGWFLWSFVVTSCIIIMYWRWIIPCNAFVDNGNYCISGRYSYSIFVRRFQFLSLWYRVVLSLDTHVSEVPFAWTGFYLRVTFDRLPLYNLPVWPTNFVSADDSTMRLNPEDCI